MSQSITADICVIGAGSGGLSVAAGASQMGANVVLIEKHLMGGDCLNTGCVPSKSLLAAAKAAQTVRKSGRFGVNGHEPDVDFAAVHKHVHDVIAAIAPHDFVERFEGFGVRVVQAAARFTGPRDVTAGDVVVRAKRFVIATGSRAVAPPVPGLDQVPYFTNETVFDQTSCPDHLIVIGGGPIGCEMAQAHRRLGARVTILERGTLLPKDDPDAVAVVRACLIDEGIAVREGIGVDRVETEGNGVAVVVTEGDREVRFIGSHLLVAAGRQPNIEGLDLDKAGVAFERAGIKVDDRLRSTNSRIYAIGDVAGGYQFTHMAGYHAGIVVRNILFRLPAKVDTKAVPWVTYTDPELAHVGQNEAVARDRLGDKVRVVTWSFEENDRAQAERATEGFVKVVTDAKGRVLGATIVGLHAGELIMPWVLAVGQGLKIGTMASMIAPYPTLSEVSKRVAGAWYTPRLFSARTRKVVHLLQKLG